MFRKIAGFELRYQLKSPVFWVVATIFFLLTFGAATIDQIRIGGGGSIHKNAPFAIAQTHLILSIFYMFVTTAFVANVVVRDGPFAMLLRQRLLKALQHQSVRVDPAAYAQRGRWQRSLDMVALGVMRAVLFLIGRAY